MVGTLQQSENPMAGAPVRKPQPGRRSAKLRFALGKAEGATAITFAFLRRGSSHASRILLEGANRVPAPNQKERRSSRLRAVAPALVVRGRCDEVGTTREPHCFIKAGSDCAADFCAEQGVQAGAYPLRDVTA